VSCKTEGGATGGVVDANGRLSLIIWSTLQTDLQRRAISKKKKKKKKIKYKIIFNKKYNFILFLFLCGKILGCEV